MYPFNERDVVARIFTRDYGILVGMLRGAVTAKKNRPLIGQCGNVVWNARLDTQLGVFHWESEKNLAAPLMGGQGRLACMNAAFQLLVTLLPERESFADLYAKTLLLLVQLAQQDETVYLEWEINLLRELGYALDLSKCSGCGTTDNLCFVSPKTGRAVCDICARPYIDRLYKMPLNMGVTIRFLENICVQQGVELPLMRRMLKIQ